MLIQNKLYCHSKINNTIRFKLRLLKHKPTSARYKFVVTKSVTLNIDHVPVYSHTIINQNGYRTLSIHCDNPAAGTSSCSANRETDLAVTSAGMTYALNRSGTPTRFDAMEEILVYKTS